MYEDDLNIEEISLILILLNKTHFSKYYSYVSKLNLEVETKNLLKGIAEYFKENENVEQVSVEEFLTYFAIKHPTLKRRASYQAYLVNLGNIKINSTVLEENMNRFLERHIASEMIDILADVIDYKTYDALPQVQSLIAKYDTIKVQLGKDETELFVTESLEEILKSSSKTNGLSWRLQCLNDDIGTLSGCSLGHLFARVDTGKTSFLASEVTNFASQLKDDQVILWFNNEEQGKKVKKRLYQATLNCTNDQLETHTAKAEEQFDKLGGHRIKIVDEAMITIDYIDSMIQKFNVALVVIDQGDKVICNSGNKYSTVEKLKEVYGKFRQLAKRYDIPILTVGQASMDAAGKKWLDLVNMDNSKTGKPGELDYAIGIGKCEEDIENGIETLRYIAICKNKMGDGHHGRHTVHFDATTARYSNIDA